MLDLVINKMMNYLGDFYKEYFIEFTVQYNSDLDMLSQYARSLNTRAIFGRSDLDLISKEDLAILRKDSNILLMYNYSPLRRVEDKFNNINFEAIFDPRDNQGTKELSKFVRQEIVQDKDGDSTIEFLKKIRAVNNDEGLELTIRDMVYGTIDFTCKFLCDSTKIMNDLQFLYIQKLQRKRSLEMTFDFAGDIGEVDFPYNIKFKDIDSIGHIDYNQYGNLQELTFTFTLEGPFFSSYSTKHPLIDVIDFKIGFTNL